MKLSKVIVQKILYPIIEFVFSLFFATNRIDKVFALGFVNKMNTGVQREMTSNCDAL